MNALIQKLYDSKNDDEFVAACNAIQKAIEAAPAEMLKELETAYEEARTTGNAAQEKYDSALSTLRESDTVENKAAAWDAYWEKIEVQGIAHALYDHRNEAGFQVEFPEEVARMRAEPVVVVGEDEIPF